jgi:hypothetical protein
MALFFSIVLKCLCENSLFNRLLKKNYLSTEQCREIIEARANVPSGGNLDFLNNPAKDYAKAVFWETKNHE